MLFKFGSKEISEINDVRAVDERTPALTEIKLELEKSLEISNDIDNIVNGELMSLLLEQAQKTESAISSVQEYISMLSSLLDEENEIVNEFYGSISSLDKCNNNLDANAMTMHEITEGLHNLKLQGLEMQKGTSEILEVIEGIKALNSRITLLSLNASIEAAKAGDNGKGFSVVAGEMKKLSQATNKSVEGIKGHIKNFMDKILGVVNNIDVCNNKVAEKSADFVSIQYEASNNIKRISTVSDSLINIKENLLAEIRKSKDTYDKISSLSKTFDLMLDIAMKISDKASTQKSKIEGILQMVYFAQNN